MFKRNKQPYLLTRFKQIEAKIAFQEHPEKQADMGSKYSRSKPTLVHFAKLPLKSI